MLCKKIRPSIFLNKLETVGKWGTYSIIYARLVASHSRKKLKLNSLESKAPLKKLRHIVQKLNTYYL